MIFRNAILLYFVITGIYVLGQTTGTYQVNINFNGESRVLAYHVPPDYDPSKTYQLIVGLHGCSGYATGYRNSLIPLTDSFDCIIVCPDGPKPTPSFIGNSTESPIILDAIEDAKSEYNIAGVYLTGFSCNGYTTAKYGLDKIYDFLGIIPLNPAFYDSDFAPGNMNYGAAVPTCICAGTADPNYANQQRFHDSLLAHNATTLFNSMPGIGHVKNFPSFNQEMMECIQFINTSISTGLPAQPNRPSDFIIFPNIANSSKIIQVKGHSTSLFITDLYGRIIKYISSTQSHFTTDNLPKGTYFIREIEGTNITSRKFIIQ